MPRLEMRGCPQQGQGRGAWEADEREEDVGPWVLVRHGSLMKLNECEMRVCAACVHTRVERDKYTNGSDKYKSRRTVTLGRGVCGRGGYVGALNRIPFIF